MKNWQVFWQFHSKSKPTGFYSTEFKNLINQMICYDPDERITMTTLINHPWTKGATSTEDERYIDFTQRTNKLI